MRNMDWRKRERESALQLHGMVLFSTRDSWVATERRHGPLDTTVRVSRRLAFIGRRVVAAGLSIMHMAGAGGKASSLVVDLLLLDLLMLVLVLMLVLMLMLGLLVVLGRGGRRMGQGRRSGRGRGGRGAGDPYWGRVGSEEVLEDRKVRHGRIHHLREMVVGELGGDEVAAPELVLAQTAALVQLVLDIAHGAVHGERHAVARDDGVVDDVRVRELLVHHV